MEIFAVGIIDEGEVAHEVERVSGDPKVADHLGILGISRRNIVSEFCKSCEAAPPNLFPGNFGPVLGFLDSVPMGVCTPVKNQSRKCLGNT